MSGNTSTKSFALYFFITFVLFFIFLRNEAQVPGVFEPKLAVPTRQQLALPFRTTNTLSTTCNTWLYQVKIGSPGVTEKIYDAASLPTSSAILAGEIVGVPGIGLLLKLDASGTVTWSKLFSLSGFSIRFKRIKYFSNNNIYIIGEKTTLATSITTPFLLSMDTSGTIIWNKEIQVQGIAGNWRGIDLAEWRENSFSFVISNDSLINVGRVTLSGTTVWNKSYKTDYPPSVLGIVNDYAETYIAFNETGSGFVKAGMIYAEFANGNLNRCSKVGGIDGSDYIIQTMQIINLRPRITALRKDAAGSYHFTRLNYDPHAVPSFRETFSINSFTPTLASQSAHDEWSQVLASTNNTFSQDVFLTYAFPDNADDPIRSKKITLPEPAQLVKICRIPDGGNLIVNNTATNDIIITKADSIGTLAGCPFQSVNSTFASQNLQFVYDTLPVYSPALNLTDLVLSSTANTPATITNCRSLFCPTVPEPDSCIKTFFKEYRNYSNCLVFRDVDKTVNDQLIATGFFRQTPYIAADEVIFTLFDSTGKIITTKFFDYPYPIWTERTIRLADNNFLVPATIYFPNSFDSSEHLIIKMDPQLNIIWIKKYQFNPRLGPFHDIIESAEGDIYCYLNDRFYSNVEKRYLLKLSATGNVSWLKSIDAGLNIFNTPLERGGKLAEAGNHIFFKYNEESSDMGPHLIKINKSDGSVVWTKKYNYAENYNFDVDNLYSLNNNLYLFGHSYSVGSIATKISTNGDVIASVKFNYNQFSISKASIKDAGRFMINTSAFFGSNLVNGIFELDTMFQVGRKSFIELPKYGYLSKTAPFNDTVTYAVGSFWYQNAYWASPYLQKYDFKNPSGICSVPNFPINVENYPATAEAKSTSANDISLPIVTNVTIPLVSSTSSIGYSNLHCNGNPLCDSIRVIGPTGVCDSTNIYTYTAIRNPGCISPVYWILDTTLNQLQIITQNDSVLKIKVKSNGTVKIKTEIFAGCDWIRDSITLNITINASLDLGPDSILCPNNTLSLGAGPGFLSYLWQDGSTDSTLVANTPGLYWVQVVDACNNLLRDTVVINPSAPIPFDLGPNLSKCNTDSLNISAPAGFINYSWSPNYNISATTSQNVFVFPLVDTMYRVVAEKTPGCFAYDSIYVNVNNSLPIYLGNDTSFCSGNSVALNAGNGFTDYLWNTGQTSASITVSAAGAYAVVATDVNNCIAKDTLRVINVFQNPVINLPNDSLLCTGSSKNLNAGAGMASYLWNTGATTNSISVNNTGTYWVDIIDNNGCKGTDTTAITRLLALPAAFLPVDTVLCSYSTLKISSSQAYSSYLWSTGSSQTNITISQPGIYWLRVTDNFNCMGSDTIIINPKQCLQGFFVPSAFTPNNDGKNDVFRPLLFGVVKQLKFTIYNRWGQVVYETTKNEGGWNGKVSGKDTDTNVFVWTCEYQFEGEEKKFAKGTVVLIR